MKKTLLFILSLLLLTISLLGMNLNIVKMSFAQETHDVAIAKVAPSETSVMQGSTVNITVVVANQGTSVENCTVSLYSSTTDQIPNIIETKSVTNLQSTLNTTLIFTWNTTSLKNEIYLTDAKEKSYTIKAVAATLPGETVTQNNELAAASPIRVLMQYIAVIPPRTLDTSLTPGKNYTVAIYTDYNGADVWCWQFSLSYNPIFLEGLEVKNGDLITTAKNPDATFVPGSFNNTKGELSLTLALIQYQTLPIPTTSGPGILARVTFRVKDTGGSNITLGDNTKLLGPNPQAFNEIEIINSFWPDINHLLYGSFSNTETQAVHDIAVLSVTPSSTVVTRGETVNIAVVVENKGTISEVFDVVLYYDYNPPTSTPTIGQPQEDLVLAPDAQKTLTFTWNTTDMKEKQYTITAIVPAVPGETNTANNQLLSSQQIDVQAKQLRPLPIIEIVIAIVVVIAVVAAVVIVRRRRRKPAPEETS